MSSESNKFLINYSGVFWRPFTSFISAEEGCLVPSRINPRTPEAASLSSNGTDAATVAITKNNWSATQDYSGTSQGPGHQRKSSIPNSPLLLISFSGISSKAKYSIAIPTVVSELAILEPPHIATSHCSWGLLLSASKLQWNGCILLHDSWTLLPGAQGDSLTI